MNFDDLIEFLARAAPTELDHAAAKRAMRRIKSDHDHRSAEGFEIAIDVDLHDPVDPGLGEARRIVRAAELVRRGSISWEAASGRLSWSDEMLWLLGRPPTIGLGPPTVSGLFNLIWPGERDAVRRQVLDAWRDRSPVDIRCRMLRPDGSAVRVDFLVEIVLDRDGRPAGIVATGEDATSAYEEPRERRTITLDLRPSVADEAERRPDEDRFALFAQPIRDLRLNQVTRYEILLRTHDGVEAAVPAEGDGWVLGTALRHIGAGPQTSYCHLGISGGALADPLLLDTFRDAVGRYGVDPEGLMIEISEATAQSDVPATRRFADGIRELGCEVALDGLGGGMPLRELTRLPVDLVKIDDALTDDLPGSASRRAIVRSLVRMCGELGIRTAATGVRDEVTLELLAEYGVDFAQGPYIGAPKPLVVRSAPTAHGAAVPG